MQSQDEADAELMALVEAVQHAFRACDALQKMDRYSDLTVLASEFLNELCAARDQAMVRAHTIEQAARGHMREIQYETHIVGDEGDTVVGYWGERLWQGTREFVRPGERTLYLFDHEVLSDEVAP